MQQEIHRLKKVMVSRQTFKYSAHCGLHCSVSVFAQRLFAHQPVPWALRPAHASIQHNEFCGRINSFQRNHQDQWIHANLLHLAGELRLCTTDQYQTVLRVLLFEKT